jgi:hypothetical protein
VTSAPGHVPLAESIVPAPQACKESRHCRYQHINALFKGGAGGRNVIHWKLIAKM